MRRIWVYQGELGRGKDFKWMSLAAFKRTFSVAQAIGFIGQIRKSVQQEAKELPREGDFYIPIRFTFPEIDGLGKLFRGEPGKGDTAANAVAFGTEYLGRVNPRYRQLFGLIFDMFRHGLAHTHMTKCARFRDAQNRWITLGLGINDTASDRHLHLTLEQREPRYFRLWLHPPQLVDDVLQAIDHYCSDLLTQGEGSKIFARFKRGYLGTAAVFLEPAAPSKPITPKKSGKKKPPKQGKLLPLNPYSSAGIECIRDDIKLGNVWSDKASP
jgi:hypothetical protein